VLELRIMESQSRFAVRRSRRYPNEARGTRLDVSSNGPPCAARCRAASGTVNAKKLADFRHPRIALAHADLSDFSLFEEAQYRGVVAAKRVLASHG
jgi:hypothetical protein